MGIFKRLLFVLLSCLLVVSMSACDPVDKDYGVTSEEENTDEFFDVGETAIMSSDRVMSQFFDISLFDEENYADIYLGKKFKINATFAGDEFVVPTKLDKFESKGWKLSEGNSYDANSLVFAYETINTVFENENGVKVSAQFYNSSLSSAKLSECYIVKFKIENDFYLNPESYNVFDVNGITNAMAITDIINCLGTPSHFYAVSEDSYYLDYFISKKDRRNGITVYINPVDDMITAIEFSYYK